MAFFLLLARKSSFNQLVWLSAFFATVLLKMQTQIFLLKLQVRCGLLWEVNSLRSLEKKCELSMYVFDPALETVSHFYALGIFGFLISLITR